MSRSDFKPADSSSHPQLVLTDGQGQQVTEWLKNSILTAENIAALRDSGRETDLTAGDINPVILNRGGSTKPAELDNVGLTRFTRAYFEIGIYAPGTYLKNNLEASYFSEKIDPCVSRIVNCFKISFDFFFDLGGVQKVLSVLNNDVSPDSKQEDRGSILPQWIYGCLPPSIKLTCDQQKAILAYTLQVYLCELCQDLSMLANELANDFARAELHSFMRFIAEVRLFTGLSADTPFEKLRKLFQIFGYSDGSPTIRIDNLINEYAQWKKGRSAQDEEAFEEQTRADVELRGDSPLFIINAIKDEIARLRKANQNAADAIEQALWVLLSNPNPELESIRKQPLVYSREILIQLLPVLQKVDQTAYEKVIVFATQRTIKIDAVEFCIAQTADIFDDHVLSAVERRGEPANGEQTRQELCKQDQRLASYELIVILNKLNKLKAANEQYIAKRTKGMEKKPKNYRSYCEQLFWGRSHESMKTAFDVREIYSRALKRTATAADQVMAILLIQGSKLRLPAYDSWWTQLINWALGAHRWGSKLYDDLDKAMPTVPSEILKRKEEAYASKLGFIYMPDRHPIYRSPLYRLSRRLAFLAAELFTIKEAKFYLSRKAIEEKCGGFKHNMSSEDYQVVYKNLLELATYIKKALQAKGNQETLLGKMEQIPTLLQQSYEQALKAASQQSLDSKHSDSSLANS